MYYKLISIVAICIVFITSSYSQCTIGTGTTNSMAYPAGNTNSGQYAYAQTVYLASDILNSCGTSGRITKIAYNVNTANTNTSWNPGWTIYMGHKNSIFSSVSDLLPITDLTEVATVNSNIFTSTGWKEITLSTPFDWNGTDNLVIYISRASSSTSATPTFYTSVGTNYRYLHGYGSSNTYSSLPAGNAAYSSANYANIQLTIEQTAAPSDCPTLISPSNGENDVSCLPTLTWSSVNQASEYYVYWNTENTMPAIPNDTVSLSTSYTISSELTSATTYYWWIVPANNIGANTSCTTSSSFITKIDYCVPSYIITGYTTYYISKFITTGGSTNINKSSSGTNNRYYDYTSSYVETTAGNNFSFTITPYNYSSQKYAVSLWIDWDKNGIIDTDERFYANSATGLHSGTISVPANISNGNYRMRIAVIRADVINNLLNPCNIYYAGEVEDYTVKITNPATVPSCSNLSYPANSSVDIETNPTFTWSEVSGAAGYKFYIGISSSLPSDAEKILEGQTNTSLLLNYNLLENTTYYWWVIPYNNVGEAISCSSFSFTTENSVSCSLCDRIGLGASESYYAPIYTYYTNRYSYTQQIYTADEILNSGCEAGDINKIAMHYKGGTSSYTITPKCKIFIAKTNETSLSSSWINTGLVEVFDGYITFAPTSVTGTAWVEINFDTPFSWDGVSNIVVAFYTYECPNKQNASFYTTSNSNPIRFYQQSGSTFSLTSQNVPTNAGDATSKLRPNIKFCITPPNVKPNCTNLINPSNGEYDVSLTPTLTWNKIDNAYSYKIYWNTENIMPALPNAISHDTSYQITALSDLATNTLYYWWVIPSNVLGDASSCSGQNFTTTDAISECNLGSGANEITLPYNCTNIQRCGSGNNITSTNSIACTTLNYLSGEDLVYTFTPLVSGCVIFDLQTTGTYTSMTLFAGCPFNNGGGECIISKANEYGNKHFMTQVFEGVTYNLVIDYDETNSDCDALINLSISFPDASNECGNTSCSNTEIAGNDCENPTPICTFNGYCGNTSEFYTPDYESSLIAAGFTGTIQNNSWLSFIAAETEVSFGVYVSNCQGATINNVGVIEGIQMQIYNNYCGAFAAFSNSWTPTNNNQDYTYGVISAENLNVGETYLLMIDGSDGDICDFVIVAESGVLSPYAGEDKIISSGECTTLTASGGDSYSWTSNPVDQSLTSPIDQSNNQSITVCPNVQTVYTVTVNGGNPDCPSEGKDSAVVYLNTTLPVTYLFMRAECFNNFAKIVWAIASQLNCDYFVVQKSEDGENFIDMETVLCNGSSSNISFYNSIDDNINLGNNYYRLKQVDYDGSENYSDIFFTSCKQDEINNFTIHSNYENININFDAFSDNKYTISIINAKGKIVYNELYFSQIDENVNILVNKSQFSQGIYFVRFSNGKETKSEKVVVY